VNRIQAFLRFPIYAKSVPSRCTDMAVEITLKLSENLVEHAKRLGAATQRDVGTVLSDVLEMVWQPIEGFPHLEALPPISTLLDEQVLALANAKMDATQNQRLGDLQAKGKTTGLSEAESYELLILLQIYQLGQLRKAEALAEAVCRGLRQPLPA